MLLEATTSTGTTMPNSLGGESTVSEILGRSLVVHIQFLQLPVCNIVDHAMYLQAPRVDSVNYFRILSHSLHPLFHVRLDQPSRLLLVVQPAPIRACTQFLSQFSQRQQPQIESGQFRISQGRGCTSAACVAANDNMLDFDVGDGESDDGLRAQVGSGEDIGNVAVDEDVAWF